jgi:hypothetical protein
MVALAIYFYLSGNCLYCQSSLTSFLLYPIGLGYLVAHGEDFHPHVAV